MAICRSQQAADDFVAGDPFVRDGTVLATGSGRGQTCSRADPTRSRRVPSVPH
jgi:hypothetical protein